MSFVKISAMKIWLPKLVLEMRRRDGDHYPPDTLYGICTALNHSLKRVNRADTKYFH